MKFQRENVQYAILSTLAITGVLVLSIAAPNLLQVLGLFSQNTKSKRYNVKRSITSLKKRGLIKGGERVTITSVGLKEYQKQRLFNINLENSNPNDKQQRIFIFDIPVSKNKIRRFLIRILKRLEFKQLQKSVWIIGCPCEKEISHICTILNIEKYCQLIVTDRIIYMG